MKTLEIDLNKYSPISCNEILLAEYDEDTARTLYRIQSVFGLGSEYPLGEIDSVLPQLDAYQVADVAVKVMTAVRAWLPTVMPETEDETNHEEAGQLDRMESERHEGSCAV